MSEPADAHVLRVLIVEDSEDDAVLVVRELHHGGYDVLSERVETARDMEAALAREWDVIISDYSMPQFSALDALAVLDRAQIDTPLLLVSGTIGEETAVSALRAGARDFFVKGRLARLVPAVEREIRETAQRRARRRAEEDLREKDRLYRTFVQHFPHGAVALFDRDLRYVLVDGAGLKEVGLSTDALEGKRVRDIFGPGVLQVLEPQLEAALRGEEQRSEIPFAGRVYEVTSVPVHTPTGSIDLGLLFTQDVSARRRAEADLRTSEARYRELVESSAQGVCLLDVAGRIIYANGRMAELVGTDTRFLVGTPASQLIAYSDQTTFELLCTTRSPVRQALELSLRKSNGDPVSTLVTYTPLQESGERALVMFLDITDRKRLEEQIRQSQKLEAIGLLAGGVAHDFNNVLAAVLMSAEMALSSPNLPDDVQRDLTTIYDSGKRASSIVRQLLAFSRKQIVKPRHISLDDVIDGMQPLLRRLLSTDIHIDAQLEATGAILMDPTQLEQVVLNLAANAGDAMPNGGVLTIATHDETLHEELRAVGGSVDPGSYCVLTVRDTGSGMDDETLNHIFEPFYTTKEQGRGTGLGLATVFGILQQAGARVRVASRLGDGTTLTLYFPRHAVDAAKLIPATPDAVDPGGNEVILVVEDEMSVRSSICRALRKHGYQILEAKHGEDALTILQEYHAPIHLLITDVVMPTMSGPDLARLLQTWYPQLPTIFVSGYSEELIEAKGALTPNSAYLAKPFTADEVARIVRQTIDLRHDIQPLRSSLAG